MKTTRDHYTSPSLDQMREIANRKNSVIPEEEPLWPDDEDELYWLYESSYNQSKLHSASLSSK